VAAGAEGRIVNRYQYQFGVCYDSDGGYMGYAILDRATQRIYPFGPDGELAEEVARHMNDGMPFPDLLPGIALTFKTIEEATDV
jgi:hypothetical protein